MKSNNLLERIASDPNIQHGKPCIKNTRTPIYVILEALAMGETTKDIKNEYPSVTDDDIRACILYAALLAKEEEIPISTS